MADFITGLTVAKTSTELIKNNNGFTKRLFAETKYLFTSINEYYRDNYERYSKLKTLIYRNEPVKLKKIYQPLNIIHEGNRIEINFENLKKISNNIIIKGTAGSGKSTAMKYLFLDCVENFHTIPLFVSLRNHNFDSQKSLYNLIVELIIDHDLTSHKRIAYRMIKSGVFLIILDGYDELPHDDKNKFIISLNHFTEHYYTNHIVLTTRPSTNIEFTESFTCVGIDDLAPEEIKDFIYRQKEPEEATHIYNSIKDIKTTYISSFYKNPLLLSLYILTHSNFADIPIKRSTFYDRVLSTLLIEHDSTSKVAFKRESFSKLNYDNMISILKLLSFLTVYDEQIQFNQVEIKQYLNKVKSKTLDFNLTAVLNDLLISYSILVDDEGSISFIHRSIQEYLAALFLKDFSKKELIIRELITNLSWQFQEFVKIYNEIDSYSYNKYFIIPSCDDFIKEYESKNTHEFIKQLYTYLLIDIDTEIIKKKFNKGEIIDFHNDFRYVFPFGSNKKLTRIWNIIDPTFIDSRTFFKDSFPYEYIEKLLHPINDNNTTLRNFRTLFEFYLDTNDEGIMKLIDKTLMLNFYEQALYIKSKINKDIEEAEKILDVLDII